MFQRVSYIKLIIVDFKRILKKIVYVCGFSLKLITILEDNKYGNFNTAH